MSKCHKCGGGNSHSHHECGCHKKKHPCGEIPHCGCKGKIVYCECVHVTDDYENLGILEGDTLCQSFAKMNDRFSPDFSTVNFPEDEDTVSTTYKTYVYNGSTQLEVFLPQAPTVFPLNNPNPMWFFKNKGADDFVISVGTDPKGDIYDSSAVASITLQVGESCSIQWDGEDFTVLFKS